MPEGMTIDVGYDSSIFIAKSIENVFETILEAIVLVVLVIFVFLRSLRATLMPIVTIPVSLIGAFIFMWAFGFSVNTLTLLAMVLAVGLVVDDAIVMLENISRHVEEGMPPFEAAIKGAREITFAVVAMTITLAAGLCAHRLPDRADRAAVHRVRLDAGRCRADLGLRGAHAVADDVLAAAAPSASGTTSSTAGSRRAERPDARLPAPLRLAP